MPLICQYCVFLACLCLKMKKINIRTISGTLGHAWRVSVYVYIPEIRFTHQLCDWECYKNPKNNNKIVFKTSLLWAFTSKRRKSVLFTFFYGKYQKSKLYAFSSKLQKFFQSHAWKYAHRLLASSAVLVKITSASSQKLLLQKLMNEIYNNY